MYCINLALNIGLCTHAGPSSLKFSHDCLFSYVGWRTYLFLYVSENNHNGSFVYSITEYLLLWSIHLFIGLSNLIPHTKVRIHWFWYICLSTFTKLGRICKMYSTNHFQFERDFSPEIFSLENFEAGSFSFCIKLVRNF